MYIYRQVPPGVFATMLRVLLSIAILFTYPLQLVPVIQVTEGLIFSRESMSDSYVFHQLHVALDMLLFNTDMIIPHELQLLCKPSPVLFIYPSFLLVLLKILGNQTKCMAHVSSCRHYFNRLRCSLLWAYRYDVFFYIFDECILTHTHTYISAKYSCILALHSRARNN